MYLQVFIFIYIIYKVGMEIQKHLFRISERTLKNNASHAYIQCFFAATLSLSTLFIILLSIGHLYILPTNNSLAMCIKESQFTLLTDAIYQVKQQLPPSNQLNYYRSNSLVVGQYPGCTIIKGMNQSRVTTQTYQFTFSDMILNLNTQMRDKLHFQNYTFFLTQLKTSRILLYSVQNLITNQLIANRLGSFPSSPLSVKSYRITIDSYIKQPPFTFLSKISLLSWTFIQYILISVVTSMYIYGTIVTAPSLIIVFLRCCNYIRNDNINEVYKIFPWIGIHSIVRESASNPHVKKESLQICKAILFYFLFMYSIYYATILWIDNGMFVMRSEGGVEEMMFGYIALIEFGAIIFMRTRTFIKFYPVFHSTLMLSFLYYCQFSQFGFKKLAYLAASSLSCCIFCWMLLKLQIPAHNQWDPASPSTPTVERPRIGLFPLFNMNWINNLPDEWAFMMPLFSRQSFQVRQLALVDRNYQQLGAALNH